MTQKPLNIAILGAGIMGLTAAHSLSPAGHEITIYDPKGFPNKKGASYIAGGMLAPYAEIEHMPLEWVAAGLAGIEFWRQFSEHHNTGFHQNGSLLIAHKEDQYVLDRFKGHLPAETQKLVRPQELEELLPAKFTNGVLLHEEAHLSPYNTLKSLCDVLRNEGVTMIEESKEPQDITKDCDFVIDARGMAINDPELRGVKGETIVVRNPEFTLSRALRLMHPRYPLYIVPRGHGVFMIGATQIESEGESFTLKSGMELMSALYSLHPSFADAEVLEMNVGIRPSYPDNLPRLTLEGNVIRAGGLFRHGFLLSPVMAECISDFVAGKTHKFMSLFNYRHPERLALKDLPSTEQDPSARALQDDKNTESKNDEDHDQRTAA